MGAPVLPTDRGRKLVESLGNETEENSTAKAPKEVLAAEAGGW